MSLILSLLHGRGDTNASTDAGNNYSKDKEALSLSDVLGHILFFLLLLAIVLFVFFPSFFSFLSISPPFLPSSLPFFLPFFLHTFLPSCLLKTWVFVLFGMSHCHFSCHKNYSTTSCLSITPSLINFPCLLPPEPTRASTLPGAHTSDMSD